MLDSDGIRPLGVNIGTAHRREYNHLLPGAGNRHVETALATDTVYGAERHRKSTLRVWRVSDGEHNDIAFITLDILQVLNKERVRLTVIKELRRPFAIFSPLIYQFLNKALLRNAKCHNPPTAPVLFRIGKPFKKIINNRFRFLRIRMRLMLIQRSVYIAEGNAKPVIIFWRRESIESIVIIVTVAKCNKRLMTTAIVPIKMGRMHAACKTFIKDTLKICKLIFVGLLIFGDIPLHKEVCRRQLLWVAYNDKLFSASDYANRLPHSHLRGLIKND